MYEFAQEHLEAINHRGHSKGIWAFHPIRLKSASRAVEIPIYPLSSFPLQAIQMLHQTLLLFFWSLSDNHDVTGRNDHTEEG